LVKFDLLRDLFVDLHAMTTSMFYYITGQLNASNTKPYL